MNNTNSTAPATRKVHFPIIEHISINGFVLYPGSSVSPAKEGLSHNFKAGVNVILGINGIGKTTLLLILYKMLSGDRDLREGEELGGSQRRLVKTDSTIFSVRVPDRAIDAKATLRFKLNDKVISITRSLKDLSLQALSVKPEEKYGDIDDLEEIYKICVCKHSGVDDFFDWILLLKYLVFYLEDRRSLVWDKWAQTEIFRILFLSETTQSNYKLLLNRALSADSQARNTQTVLSNEEKKLARLKAEIDKAGPEDLKVLRGKKEGFTARSTRLAEQLEELEARRLDYRDNAARLRSAAEKLTQEELSLREMLLASLFPKLSDYGAFVLASIEAQRGCIICGCKDPNHLKHIQSKIHDGLVCPICEADPALQETGIVSPDYEVDKERLNELSSRAKKTNRDAKTAEIEEEKALQDYLQIRSEKYELDKELRATNQKLLAAENAAGILENNVITTTTDRLQILKDSIEEYKEEKNDALEELKALIDSISANVSAFKEELINNFQSVISSFLAERCELTFRTAARNIGQSSSSIDLLFPEFHVLMTSGVFRETGTPREETGSVSESQKEFIELAFRMALLSASAGDSGCSLVIETPEASLDAVFIPKAGKALNEFTNLNPSHPSTVIASSNLNGSEMIPALLGILETAKFTAQETKEKCLNLMDFAAKNAALREYSTEYDYELKKSLRISR